MHKLDCNRALANGGGTAFYRVIANVSSDEDTWSTGFKQIRLAVETPRSWSLRLQIGARKHKAFTIADYLLWAANLFWVQRR